MAGGLDREAVPAPGYEIDTDGLQVSVDGDQVVLFATGEVVLTLPVGATAGQTYVVVDAYGLDTYEELEAAYGAGAPVAMGNIPAAALDLAGAGLSGLAIRTIIIANVERGIAAYQAFEVTFHPAAHDAAWQRCAQ